MADDLPMIENDDEKTCWICLGNESDDRDIQQTEWLSPCKCSGSMQFVHTKCILRWINDHGDSERVIYICI